MSYQICFVRDDQVVGYLGREGMDGEILRENKKEAVDMHDLKAASRKAQELKRALLPESLKNADPRSLMMFNFVVDRFEIDTEKGHMVAKFGEKHFIKVISAATGGAVETYPYEPK
jgi:hypothetical protein